MTYKIPEDIIVTELDNNEAILLDMRSKRYYSLNETALVIFKGIESNLTREQIIEQIMSAYDVDRDNASKSVESLVQKLLSFNIIEQHET
ncbi:MAG: PqqD family protein [bacterium]